MDEAEMSDNLVFFKKSVFNRPGNFGKGRSQLKAGQYLGELIEIKPGQGPNHKGDGVRDTLAFQFRLLHNDHDQLVSRTVTQSISVKGAFFSLVNGMSPLSFDVLNDGPKLEAHMLSLIGKTFLLHIEPTKCGKYNNIEFVTPDCRAGA